LCFYGSYPLFADAVNNNWIFFTWWVINIVWTIFLYNFAHLFRNYFSVRCEFVDATHVSCSTPQEVITMSHPVEVVVWFRNFISQFKDSSVDHFTSNETVYSENGFRFFSFMCQRYTYDDRKKYFDAFIVKIPETYDEISRWSGLTDSEASERQVHIGKNEIPFKVETWGDLILLEFTTYLYLYQFIFLSCTFWFNGLFYV
jgi:hypothetical protein